MRLFVDDLRPPYDTTWVTARTYEEAVRQLETGLVTELSLDHDLGTERDGHDVFIRLEELVERGEVPLPLRVFVHTANAYEKVNMQRAVRRLYERRAQHDEKGEQPCGSS